MLVVTSYSALSFNINPLNQDIEVFTVSSANAFINITNTLNETAYYITLKSSNTDITFVDNSFNLTTGETKQIKIVIDSSISYNKEEEISVIYFKKQSVLLTPTQEIVHITNTQYNPSNKEIIQGSTIKFVNSDTIKHSVTSSLFDSELNPGQEFSYTFSNTGIVAYHDKYTNFQGSITIIDTFSNEFAHDPNKDEIFKLAVQQNLYVLVDIK